MNGFYQVPMGLNKSKTIHWGVRDKRLGSSKVGEISIELCKSEQKKFQCCSRTYVGNKIQKRGGHFVIIPRFSRMNQFVIVTTLYCCKFYVLTLYSHSANYQEVPGYQTERYEIRTKKLESDIILIYYNLCHDLSLKKINIMFNHYV